MSSYIMRMQSQADKDLWARFKVRAAQDGIPMRALMLKLVELYASGKIAVKAERTPDQVSEHRP
jgi:hypothetical protein